jgi:hypothetical protein
MVTDAMDSSFEGIRTAFEKSLICHVSGREVEAPEARIDPDA